MFYIACLLCIFSFHSAQAETNPHAWVEPKAVEWVYDVDGQAYDVVNVYIHGTREAIFSAFESSGWKVAAKADGKNNFKYIGAIALDGAERGVNGVVAGAQKVVKAIIHHPMHAARIPNPSLAVIQKMPVSPEFHNGIRSEFEFEMNNHPFGGREHFRVFDTHQVDENQYPVWAVSVSKDIKIKFDRNRPKQFFLNHLIEANEDLERDVLFKSLSLLDSLLKVDVLQLNPVTPAQADGAYSADGRVYDLTFASPQSAVDPESP